MIPVAAQPAEPLHLGRDDVHAWIVALRQTPAEVENLWRVLAPDERDRADRFHFERDRQQFILSHAALRSILGRYLASPPEQVALCLEPGGKPAVFQDRRGAPLRFNLSHSGDLALVGVARGRAIGADVERIRPELAGEHMARRFFSPREAAALRSLPPHQQPEAFYRCWTRKEAYLKARGDGLAFPLDAFDVSLAPGEPPALLRVHGDPRAPARWRLADLPAGPGYAAALAVEGGGWRLTCLEMQAGEEEFQPAPAARPA